MQEILFNMYNWTWLWLHCFRYCIQICITGIFVIVGKGKEYSLTNYWICFQWRLQGLEFSLLKMTNAPCFNNNYVHNSTKISAIKIHHISWHDNLYFTCLLQGSWLYIICVSHIYFRVCCANILEKSFNIF